MSNLFTRDTRRVLIYCLPVLVLLSLALAPGGFQLRGADLQYPIAVVAAESGDLYIAVRQLRGSWRLRDGKVEPYWTAK